MAARVRINSAVLDRKIAATARAMAGARDGSIEAMGELAVDTLVAVSPRDTNRYVNSWIDAGRKAGVSTTTPLPIVPSANQRGYLDALARQVDRLGHLIDRDARWMRLADTADMRATPRKDGKARARRADAPWYRRAAARVRSNEKRLLRARMQLADALGADSFLFFDADAVAERGNARLLSTVRTRVYGGEGETALTPAGKIVRLGTLEPHARIVEKHPGMGHPVATTRALLRANGAAVGMAAYRRLLRAASPMAA